MKLFKKFRKNDEEIIDINNEYEKILVSKRLETNRANLKNIFKDCDDIILRDIKLHIHHRDIEILLVHTNNLVDKKTITDEIIKPLNIYGLNIVQNKKIEFSLGVIKDILSVNSFKEISNLKEGITGILSGYTLLLLDGFNKGLLLSSEGKENRSIEESTVESVIRGPRDSFIENINTNIGLIRHKLKSTSLKVKYMTIGKESNTTVSIVYMENIVNKDALSEVMKKLKEIEIDGIFEVGYIEQFLSSNPYSLFPQMQITERPDKACGNLLEGRIVILVDGSPVSLILPISFLQLFQSPEDYYERVPYGNFIRFLRYIGFVIATSLPSIYVALISFHQEMVPMNLLVDLSKTRAEVPFPPVIEALLMEITIELLREASARLPGTVGQTIGIVGAIVIGDAAIQAGLASPAMIIVVAVTAIGSYVLPHYSTSYALRMVRFPIILLAASFGAFGIVIAWTWIFVHLCSLSSLGYPYLSPLSPIGSGIKRDAFHRSGFWKLKRRPQTAMDKNRAQ